jgi:hypothetical protein
MGVVVLTDPSPIPTRNGADKTTKLAQATTLQFCFLKLSLSFWGPRVYYFEKFKDICLKIKARNYGINFPGLILSLITGCRLLLPKELLPRLPNFLVQASSIHQHADR